MPRSLQPAQELRHIVGVMLVAIILLLSAASAAASGLSEASDWAQDLVTHIELIQEQAKRWAMVEIQVDSVSSGTATPNGSGLGSEVIASVLKIHAGALDDSPRWFVECGYRQDPVHGTVSWGSRVGREAQQWLLPGDHVLALVWSASEESLRAGDKVGNWWASGPWWLVQLAAHIEGEELRVVTAVAPPTRLEQLRQKRTNGHPNRLFERLRVRTWADARPEFSEVLREVMEVGGREEAPR